MSADNILLSPSGRVVCSDVEEATAIGAHRDTIRTPGYWSNQVPGCSTQGDAYAVVRLVLFIDHRRWHDLVKGNQGGEHYRPTLDLSKRVHRWCLRVLGAYGLSGESVFCD